MFQVLMIAAALIAIFVAVDFLIAYLRSKNTGTARLWDAGRGSATMVVGQLGLIGGGIDVGIGQLANYLGMPGVTDAIKGYLPDQAVGAAVMVFAAVTIAARLRTLGKS